MFVGEGFIFNFLNVKIGSLGRMLKRGTESFISWGLIIYAEKKVCLKSIRFS